MALVEQRLFGTSYQSVLTRTFTMQALGTARQAALAAVDATLAPAWFVQLLADATAAQALPGLDMRRADQHQTVLSRDEALALARPLLQDLFFYAKKAYPAMPHADDLFGHRAVTAAGANPGPLNTALQAAAQQVLARKTALLSPGGMPEQKIDTLLALAETAQAGTVTVHVAEGEGTVDTGAYVGVFNALWRKVLTLHEAAQVAYRLDEAQRRLFRLYPDGAEERRLTADAALPPPADPVRRVVRLDSTMSMHRLLSLTVAAPGGAVRVALLAAPPSGAFAGGVLLESTPPRHPARLRVQDLGPAGAQYLVLENTTAERATLQLRVGAIGEEE